MTSHLKSLSKKNQDNGIENPGPGLEQAQKSVCFDNLSKLYLWQAWFQVMKIYVSIFLHNIRLMIKMEYKKNLREKPNKYHRR
jgi:hypothetical protein